MTTNTEISLIGQLQREYRKAQEQYSININNQDKSMYFLGKMDGIEAAIKVLAVEATK
jgi:phosphate-selective porin